MKVETPQVRWHADDKGKNQALFGVSLLPGSPDLLATAGNTFHIHLWQAHLEKTPATFTFLTSLTRHESSVNALSFSPDGLHLASVSDSGSVIVWSVPANMRGNNNGRHYWSQVAKESDLRVSIVPRGGDGITDLSWSSNSKRFVVGTVDNAVLVYENVNANDSTQESSWKCVHRNSVDHSHFVQGVAFDPQGVYLASMSSDRTVRIHPRKVPGKKKKKVLRTIGNASSSGSNNNNNNIPPLAHQAMVEALLTDSKLEMCTKSKQIKYRKLTVNQEAAADAQEAGPKPARQALFADESTLQSFVRRLAWTPDGAFLVTPAVMWQTTPESPPQFATCMWGRHNWDEPARVLLGMEKPSVAIRPNPMLFQLPPSVPSSPEEEAKENKSLVSPNGLPYRSIFAVLTWDSVLIYDTVHAQPLAVVRGIHYAHLNDATWSADGRHLIVCSSDGYVTVMSFADGELGEVYTPPALPVEEQVVSESASVTENTTGPVVDSNVAGATGPAVASPSPKSVPKASTATAPLPPCEPGNATVLEGPPAKKQKTRIAPTCISGPPDVSEDVKEAVDQLSLNEQARKKKRIQPTLVSSG